MKFTQLLSLISLLTFLGSGIACQRDIHALQNSKKVDVGGHLLRTVVTGHGTPTVVLESGSGSQIEDSWAKVQPEIAKLTRVVAYDRAGIGESEPGQQPRTAQQIATELNAALKKSGLTPPYILVGHSIGGPYIHVFAHRYPNEVAGMVFVDPTPEAAGQKDLMRWAQVHHAKQYREVEDKLTKAELSEGIRNWMRIMCAESLRLMEEIVQKAPKGLRHEWTQMMEREIQGFLEEPTLEGLRQMPRASREEEIDSGFSTLEQARAAWPLPDVPVVLIASSKPRETRSNSAGELALEKAKIQVRLEGFKEWLRQVPRGEFIVTEKSGHLIPNEEPELIIDAIRQVMRRAKKSVGQL